MTTYVLGAGASCHVGYPLTAELGNALREWIHRSKPPDHNFRIHVDELHRLYNGLENIEVILTDLDEASSLAATLPDPVRARILADLRRSIREFFNDLRQTPAPLYARLAGERIQSDDVIITLNYDVALERELKQTGLWEVSDGYGDGFRLDIDAIRPSPVRVLKLHGSTNWWGLIFGGTRGPSQVSNVLGPRPVIFLRPDLEYFGYSGEVSDPLCAGVSKAAGAPAIVMPTQHKRFFEQTSFGREWELFWDDLWGQARNAVQSSGKIVIIGYSMPVADEEARKLLLKHSNRNADISIFCGRRSEPICNEFRARGFTKVSVSGDNPRFEDFLGCDSHSAAQTA